ncbi:MAG: UDP-N-acetylmuramoyl-L-alanyl-D-glutamate--2,6-diaminopimelate ligase, partial [Gammaproteobacteria bacterium]
LRGAPLLAMGGLSGKLGELAARYYGDPSGSMSVIGITGTNGKTSCSQFLSQLLPACGIIGTLGWGEWGRLDKTHNTTPDAVAVQRIMAELRNQHKRSVAMEVSSHGLEQGRVNGVHFRGAVFTNISRDHLDYHGTMAAYVAAKLNLLKMPGLDFAVVNLDDDYAGEILEATPDGVAVWGVSRQGRKAGRGERVTAENIRHTPGGVEFELCWRQSRVAAAVPLFGDFNIDNSLSVLAVMLALGEPLDQAVRKMRWLKPVPGRMQRFGQAHQPVVFVDYAHTPDALEKVLASVRQHCPKHLWVVFGCGGNRDRGKRAEMGTIASRWADHIILTDDNPRHESGQEIVDDILTGCRKDGVQVIRDRERAIKTAVTSAAPDDWIVVAGKGHEDYQEIQGVRYPFSDAETVENVLRSRAINGEHATE